MHTPVSIYAKKQFLQWFIAHYPPNAQEINWFLEDLIEDERALFYLHFVRHIENCPKGIIISTQTFDDLSFLFFKGSVQTSDVYTAYHEFHLYNEEKFYIQVNFPQQLYHPLYEAVLEEEDILLEKDKIQAETLLQHLLEQGKKDLLKHEIDKALDNSDNKKFIIYTEQLKRHHK